MANPTKSQKPRSWLPRCAAPATSSDSTSPWMTWTRCRRLRRPWDSTWTTVRVCRARWCALLGSRLGGSWMWRVVATGFPKRIAVIVLFKSRGPGILDSLENSVVAMLVSWSVKTLGWTRFSLTSISSTKGLSSLRDGRSSAISPTKGSSWDDFRSWMVQGGPHHQI